MDSGRKLVDSAQSTRFPSALVQDQPTRHGGHGNTSSFETVKLDQSVQPSDSILIAAWALVVALHGLEEDVVFDLSLQGRTSPCRVNVSDGDVTAQELITDVEASLKENGVAQPKTKSSYAKSQDSINQEGETGTSFSCLQISSHALENDALDSIQSRHQSAALLVKCHKTPNSTELSMAADPSQITPMVSRSLLAHFKSAIMALSSDQQTRLNDINLSDDADFKRVQCWTQAPEPVATQPLLHISIEEQARSNPLAVAIGQTDSVMTYAELDKGASALARHLLASQSSPDSIGNVAIVFSKSSFAVLAMLAILKAGGAFVPIDTQWPPKRIEKILTNTQTKTILCSQDQKSRLDTFSSVNVVPVTPQSIYALKKAQKNEQSPLLPSVQSEAPAYILHTSGSTGQPKGIAISHRSITTSINAMARYFGTNSATRAIQFNAFTFDVSVADIWMTLSRGGRVCMPSEEQRFSLDEFILAERCNFVFVTPSVAATIDPDLPKKHLCKLAVIGEAVTPGFLRRYAPVASDSRQGEAGLVLCNTWGPTEASVVGTGSTPITVRASDHTLTQRAGNIGWPVGCGLFIVSARNPHVLSPAYVPGEIALVGPTLATGYWGDEEATKSAFREDLEWAKDKRWRERFGDDVMSKVYLTGDIGRYSEEGDGSVIFMHRRGGYMKVNGLRIEPGEVESAVAEVGAKLSKTSDVSMPHWARTVVSVLERNVSGNEQQQLVCFLADNEQAGEPGAGCKQTELEGKKKALLKEVAKGLKDVIPEYMVPSLFVSVAKMPVTTSSKVDRKALLALFDDMDWGELVRKYSLGGKSA